MASSASGPSGSGTALTGPAAATPAPGPTRGARRNAARQAEFVKLHSGTSVRTAYGIPLAVRIQNIWDRRDVMWMLTTRGLKAKYSSSVLGYAWSLIDPAMQVLIYYLLLKVFHRSYPDYPLFVGCTILPWQWFQSTVSSATSTLRSNARLITSVNLPREIYPLADIAEKTVEFVLSIPVLLVLAVLYGIRPSGYALLLPFVLVFELMLCIGMGLLVAALNTVVRDIQRGIGIVLRLMFYSIPVIYPLNKLSPTFAHLISYNPLTGIMLVQRATWFPAYWAGYHALLYTAVGSVAVLVAGVLAFVRLEPTVLKEL